MSESVRPQCVLPFPFRGLLSSLSRWLILNNWSRTWHALQEGLRYQPMFSLLKSDLSIPDVWFEHSLFVPRLIIDPYIPQEAREGCSFRACAHAEQWMLVAYIISRFCHEHAQLLEIWEMTWLHICFVWCLIFALYAVIFITFATFLLNREVFAVSERWISWKMNNKGNVLNVKTFVHLYCMGGHSG